jgi:hypothetical protein
MKGVPNKTPPRARSAVYGSVQPVWFVPFRHRLVFAILADGHLMLEVDPAMVAPSKLTFCGRLLDERLREWTIYNVRCPLRGNLITVIVICTVTSFEILRTFSRG